MAAGGAPASQQLCHLVQFNLEEALASPELPLRVVRKRATDMPGAERFDLDDEDSEEEQESPGVKEETSLSMSKSVEKLRSSLERGPRSSVEKPKQ